MKSTFFLCCFFCIIRDVKWFVQRNFVKRITKREEQDKRGQLFCEKKERKKKALIWKNSYLT